MFATLRVVVFLSVLGASVSEAQEPLVPRKLALGFSVALPTHWAVVTSLGPAQRLVDSVLRRSEDPDTALQAALRSGQYLVVMVAADTARGLSANLNVVPVTGATATTFDAYGVNELEAHTANVCRVLANMLRRSGGTLGPCGPATRDTLGGHALVLLVYERTDSGGSNRVWLAQYAMPGAIVSLTLIARQAEADSVTPLMERLWRSVRLP